MQVKILHKTIKNWNFVSQRWIWMKTRLVCAVKNFIPPNAQKQRLYWSYTTWSHAVLLIFFSRYSAHASVVLLKMSMPVYQCSAEVIDGIDVKWLCLLGKALLFFWSSTLIRCSSWFCNMWGFFLCRDFDRCIAEPISSSCLFFMFSAIKTAVESRQDYRGK